MREITNDVKKVLGLAETFASHTGSLIDSMHLLIALASVEHSYSYEILNRLGFTAEIAKSYLISVLNQPPQPALPGPMYKKIMEYAGLTAQNSGYGYIDTQHILLSVSFHKTCLAGKVLMRHGIDYSTVFSIVSGMTYNKIGKDYKINNTEEKKPDAGKVNLPAKQVLKELDEKLLENGVDLTARAREGKIDPVFGRDKEINRVIQILSRRNKNNPIIIGEPGVGKTAVIEGLAQRIVDGEVPDFLKNKIIYSLNVNSLISGTRYRGELEEKIKVILNLIKEKDIILFIDEMHTIVTAGSSEGGMNIGNILKPSLAGGAFSTIGATTITEYRKFIEKDSALERRFMPVKVEETTVAATVNILKGLKEKFEKHHGLKITDEALKAASELSARYISDRFLPDKAIDVLDEACSKKRNVYVGSGEKELLKSDIQDVIVEMTGIPLQNLTETESERLINMESALNERVIGQDEALKAISKAIRRSRSGLKDPTRPVGSFIFLGPTGVGKTETAKALSEFLFGDESALIRLDMSEYMEKNSSSRLIGAPPGYVGYDEGGYLTEAVRRKPYSVILLDEIEKAHGDVFNMLLQVLDDGRLTDSKGRTVDFKNTIIIMTSNIGTAELNSRKVVGFGKNNNSERQNSDKDIQLDALKQAMRPEFINRIDNIIVFNKLNKDNIKSIANLLIEQVGDVLKAERNIELNVSDSVLEYLADESFDEEYGARPLKRVVETKIEDRLSDEIIRNDLRNTVVKVILNNGQPEFINTGG